MDSSQQPTKMRIGPQPGPQTEFAKCSADLCIFGGSAFGGKTYSLLLEPLRAVHDPRFTGVIFRRERPQITAGGGLWDTSGQIYPHTGAVPTESKLLWQWPSGAALKFTHLQLESDKNAHQGAAYAFIGFDELELFTEAQFWFLWTRNRPPAGYVGRCWCRAGTNPNADSWIRELLDWWIGPDGYPIRERSGVLRYFTRVSNRMVWVTEDWRSEDGNPPKSLTFIPSLIEDNVIGNSADPSYKTNLYAQDEVTRERFLKGNWNITYTGGMFAPDWFRLINNPPDGLRKVRYWDLASTPKDAEGTKDPDWTAGVLLGEKDGDYYVLDVVRTQGTPGDVETLVRRTAEIDGKEVLIGFEEEHGASGKYTSDHFARVVLKDYDVWPDYVTGNKTERAKPLAADAEHGHVYVVRGEWNRAWLAEIGSFPLRKRDMVDATTGARKLLTTGHRVWAGFARTPTYCGDFRLIWGQAEGYFHFGAIVVGRDLRIYVTAASYVRKENKLYVYGELAAPQLAIATLADRIVAGMGFKTRKVHGIFGNADMFASSTKSLAATINKEIRRAAAGCSSIAYVHPAEQYDRIGTIAAAGLMFHERRITVHESCTEAIRQYSSWRIEEGKPLERGFEFCEGLCLIISAVNKYVPKVAKLPPGDPHYRKRKALKDIKPNMNSFQIA